MQTKQGNRHTGRDQKGCLESPRDWGAWWAAVYRVAQSRTCKPRPPCGRPAHGHEQRNFDETEGCLISLPHSRGGRSSTTLVWSDLGASHCTQVERRAWLWPPSGEWARNCPDFGATVSRGLGSGAGHVCSCLGELWRPQSGRAPAGEGDIPKHTHGGGRRMGAGDFRCHRDRDPHFTTSRETDHSHLSLARRKRG